MATYFARSSGNINGAIWATTPSGSAGSVTFAGGDVLVANSFTVTVNVSTNLGNGTVTNDTTGGATVGGTFSLSNGVTLTANVTVGNTVTACVTTASTVSASVVGNATGGVASGAAISHASSGSLTFTGNATGGSGNFSYAIGFASTGSLSVTGNITGGSFGTAYGLRLQGAGSVTVTGTVTGGTAASGINCNSSGPLTVTGTSVGAAAPGIDFTSSSTVATVTRAKGGPLAASAVGVAAQTSGSATASVEEIEYGDLGASPTSGPIRLTDRSSNVCLMYRFNSTKKTLVDTASTSLIPAASDVRSGTVYNAGQTTGTCAVPGAASVLVGVAVDNTTGTAAVSSSAIQSACDAALVARNVATFASVGQQLSNALTP